MPLTPLPLHESILQWNSCKFLTDNCWHVVPQPRESLLASVQTPSRIQHTCGKLSRTNQVRITTVLFEMRKSFNLKRTSYSELILCIFYILWSGGETIHTQDCYTNKWNYPYFEKIKRTFSLFSDFPSNKMSLMTLWDMPLSKRNFSLPAWEYQEKEILRGAGIGFMDGAWNWLSV